jgi:hypothetical protein
MILVILPRRKGLANKHCTTNLQMRSNRSEKEKYRYPFFCAIERFLGQALRNDVQRIEYRQRFIAYLQMPAEHHQNEIRGRMAIRDNFSQKGAGT